MKKFIIFIAMLLTCQNVFANPNTTIDKIENALYGFTYANESEANRLNRIEESVYGKTSTGQIQTRIAKLKKDLSADLMGQEIEPKEDTFASEEDSWVFAKEPKEASKMDYPVINELEKQVFKQEFKDQNIKTRLSKLEQKALGKTFENDDLATRVDRLKAEVQPKTFMDNKMAKQENTFYDDPFEKMDQDYHIDSYGPPEFDYDSYNNSHNFDFPQEDDYFSSAPPKPVKNMSLSSIEKTLYKTKFENESNASRLARIESSVFGTSFANDSESERIARISSALNAQKTAKRYDSNKFGQNMATAVQIGTLILMVLACIL